MLHRRPGVASVRLAAVRQRPAAVLGPWCEWLALALAFAVASCAGDDGPTPPPDPDVLVSSPIERDQGRAGTRAVAYVSASPGSFPRGTVVTLRNLSASDGRVAIIRDGGFDPVAVTAMASDRIEVVTTDSTDATTTTMVEVKQRTPTRVVRVSPGPRQTDVPLNAVIQVVFSAPVTQVSAREGIRVTVNGVTIDGTIEQPDPEQLSLYFRPTSPLAPATDHVVEVTQAIRGVNGLPLAEAVSVEFRTGTSGTPASGNLAISLLALGQDIQDAGFSVRVSGVTYPLVTGSPVRIQQLDPGTYGVALDGTIASNCALEGAAERLAVVTAGTTADVAFVLWCTRGAIVPVRVTATTTGVSPDTNGYEVSFSWSTGSTGFLSTGIVPANGTTERGLEAGISYLVSVNDVAANCRVGDAPPGFTYRLPNLDLTNEGAEISFSVACAAPRQLAFASGTGSASDIYLFTTDGTRQVLPAAGADSNPAWSRSGAELAFTSDRDGNPEIYRMNADGSGATRLTTSTGADYRPAWSPDGSRIAFVSERDGNPEIYVVSRDGTGLRRLTTSPGIDTEPAWSPDGTQLVFASNRDGAVTQLYVMNADGSNVERRTNSATNDRTPAWSPDGGRIAFSRTDAVDPTRHRLFVMEATGAQPRSLSDVYSATPVDPDFSPDGLQIAFVNSVYEWFNVFPGLLILDLNGTGPVVTALAELGISNPSWRP